MVVRTDIIVDFTQSPRIITVLSPSVNLSIQDLVDTCRSIEVTDFNLIYDHLIDASGKQNLGGGLYVGVTASLNNALIAFQARSGPSYIQCTVNGGNLVAIDSNGNNISPIQPTAFTQVITTSSSSSTLITGGSALTNTQATQLQQAAQYAILNFIK